MSAEGGGVKLLGVWSSPFSVRVEIALKLKGIQYELIEEDLSNKSDLLLNYNPVHKKVPVLLNNGKPMSESLIIMEYIDETWKHNPILPKDPFDRAIARFWAKFIDDKFLSAIRKAWFSPEEKERQKGVEEVKEVLIVLENELKDGRKFFGGHSIGVVDIAGILVGHWLRVVEEIAGVELLTSEKYPKLNKWSEELVSHHVVKEMLPPVDKLLGYYKARAKASTAA